MNMKSIKTRADDKEADNSIPRQIELEHFQKGKHSLHHTEDKNQTTRRPFKLAL